MNYILFECAASVGKTSAIKRISKLLQEKYHYVEIPGTRYNLIKHDFFLYMKTRVHQNLKEESFSIRLLTRVTNTFLRSKK